MRIRSLIVDDNRPFLDAARTLLEREGVAVVGVATTSAEALRLEEELRPDVVLVDIRLGDESGFELARRLNSTVILISTHAESEFAEEIAASPAAGFVHKGDFFGEIAILGDGRRSATVTSTSPVQVLVMFGTEFRRLEAAHPEIASRIAEAMQARVAGRISEPA